MRYLYFDIETTGFNPELDKITLINIYDIHSMKEWVYKEWTYGERAMLKKVIDEHPNLLREGFYDDCDVLVNTNVIFDMNFVCARLRRNHLRFTLNDFSSKPKIDTQGMQIIANKMFFKGSGINSFTGKKGSGLDAVAYYKAKEYDKLVQYSVDERVAFIDWLMWLVAKLPNFIGSYKHAGNSRDSGIEKQV